ncbi:MAG: hypothetical protein AAGE18_14125 [Pseudomonadota bacterium]
MLQTGFSGRWSSPVRAIAQLAADLMEETRQAQRAAFEVRRATMLSDAELQARGLSRETLVRETFRRHLG